jgi:DNA replication factor GINS
MGEYASKLKGHTRMLEKGSMRWRISEKERENAERMLEDLTQTRLRKILNAELEGKTIEASFLTPEERKTQAELKRILREHSEWVKSILMGYTTRIGVESKTSKFKVVRFMEPLPAIIGIDMKTYGPFQPEDVASIPVENAVNLIRRGIAKEIVVPE